MSPELPRTGLNGSALVGLLAQLSLVEKAGRPPAFVEGLTRWVGWKDAIALSAALQAPPPAATSGIATDAATECAALDAAFTRLQAEFERALAAPPDDGPPPAAGDFLPWRRHHARLQQWLEQRCGALRTQARATLQRVAAGTPPRPALARLAALDAALASALAPREQAQLALMPALLEKLHRREPASFAAEWPRLLRAELELRLQPAEGLRQALLAALHELP